MITLLTASGLRWMERHRQRARLRKLLEQDDRMLDDIGMTRAEILGVLDDPVDRDIDLIAEVRRRSRRSLRLDRRMC